MPIDHSRAIQVIDKHVMSVPWVNAYWRHLVYELIDPLGLTEAIGGDVAPFCDQAGSNILSYIRSDWREYWTREIWEERSGPWTRLDGMLKIIEIVRKTAIRWGEK